MMTLIKGKIENFVSFLMSSWTIVRGLLNRNEFEIEIEKIYQIFPELKELEDKRAGLLSRGEKFNLHYVWYL
ncbi:MAG: hypothetical protein ABIM98_06900 [candidate division WOR-3 bacterium]